MFKRFFLAAASVAALAAASPSARAEETQPLPAAEAQDLQTWLTAIAVWATPYAELVVARGSEIDQTIALADEVSALVDQGDMRGARSLFEAQAPTIRKQMRAADARAEALPVTPAGGPAWAMDAAEFDRLVVQRRAAMIGFMHQTTRQSNDLIASIQRVAVEGDAAMQDLGMAMFGMGAATLQAENVLLESQRVDRAGVAYQFYGSMIASNKAMAEWLSHVQAKAFDPDVTGTTAAQRMRAHVQDSRAAIVAFRGALGEFRAKVSAETTPGSELAVNMSALIDSFETSADVEDRLADTLEGMAGVVQKGDPDAILDSGDGIQPIVDERVRLDQGRRALLAGA